MISFPANLWKLKFKWLLSEKWLPKLCFKCWSKKADRAGKESTSQLKVFVTIFLIVTKYAILSRLLDCRELRAFPGTFFGRIPGTLNFYWCVPSSLALLTVLAVQAVLLSALLLCTYRFYRALWACSLLAQPLASGSEYKQVPISERSTIQYGRNCSKFNCSSLPSPGPSRSEQPFEPPQLISASRAGDHEHADEPEILCIITCSVHYD